MTRARLIFLVLSLSVLVPIVTGGISRAVATDGDESEESLFKSLSIFTEVLQLVRQAYVDEKPLDELMLGALEGTTDALGPFATYVPAERVAGYAKVREVGDRHSGMTVARERGIVYVAAVAPASPAAEAGVEAGDIIAKLEGLPTQSTPLWEVVSVLGQAPDTKVSLGLLRRGQSLEVELTLAEFSPQLPSLETVDDVPMIVVSSFSTPAVQRLGELLTSIEGDTLLLDLRGASGLEFENAYAMAELFVGGPLGGLLRKSETLESFQSKAEKPWSGRLVVLVNQAAFGAAEVLAAVLQQATEAKIVGERTFGYAGRQTTETLSGGDLLVITDAFYSGPDGEKLLEGVEPDFEPDLQGLGFGDQETQLDDLILERALELLGEVVELDKAA